MPETDVPKLKLWLPKLIETIGEPDDELFLVGHSIGCATILRYLEQLPEGQQIGGAVLVAGFTDDLKIPELANFYGTPMDFAKIRAKSAKGFVNIHSDNDPYVPLVHSANLKEALGGEAIVLPHRYHFSGPADDEPACTELPEVISAVEKISQ